jgi:hypothetical protein
MAEIGPGADMDKIREEADVHAPLDGPARPLAERTRERDQEPERRAEEHGGDGRVGEVERAPGPLPGVEHGGRAGASSGRMQFGGDSVITARGYRATWLLRLCLQTSETCFFFCDPAGVRGGRRRREQVRAADATLIFPSVHHVRIQHPPPLVLRPRARAPAHVHTRVALSVPGVCATVNEGASARGLCVDRGCVPPRARAPPAVDSQSPSMGRLSAPRRARGEFMLFLTRSGRGR